MTSATSDRDQVSPSFPALIEDREWVPDASSTQTVIETLVEEVHDGSGAPEFTAVTLTSVQMEESMWSEREERDGTTYVRLRCDLTSKPFWLTRDIPVPAVAFRYEDEDETVERWTEVVHPRLATDREDVMRGLVQWIQREVFDASARLEFMLRRLRCLRKQADLEREQPLPYTQVRDGEPTEAPYFRVGPADPSEET